MLNTPFPDWPSYSEEEVEAVSRVLRSNRVNYWTGRETRAFEGEFAAYVGCAHAVALANGTLALDIALSALGIGPGDDVVVTPRTYIASVSSVVGVGARPVFADVDRDTQTISATSIEAVLTPATKAVVVVHLAGMAADMDPILVLAKKHGFEVIEDCAQAHGARYKGRSVGSIGAIGTWSFCQDKIMTTGGEGGMVTTDDSSLFAAMWSLKDHGKARRALRGRGDAEIGYRWLHDSFGTNARMTEMQGVLGRLQLARMPDWRARRIANAERIWTTCRDIDWLRAPIVPAHIEHAAYKAYVFVEPDRLPAGWSRDDLLEALVKEGIPAFQGICPEVYREKAFDDTGFRPAERLPVARELGETSLMFLVHPTLDEVHIIKSCAAIRAVAERVAGAARHVT